MKQGRGLKSHVKHAHHGQPRRYLSLLIVLETQGIEFFEDLLCSLVLFQLAFAVEANHVGSIEVGCKLQDLLQTSSLSLGQTCLVHLKGELYSSVGGVVEIVLAKKRRMHM